MDKEITTEPPYYFRNFKDEMPPIGKTVLIHSKIGGWALAYRFVSNSGESWLRPLYVSGPEASFNVNMVDYWIPQPPLPQEKKMSERVSEVVSNIDYRKLSDDEVRDLFSTLNNAFLDVLEETNKRGFRIS